jgi:hypothetical protein
MGYNNLKYNFTVYFYSSLVTETGCSNNKTRTEMRNNVPLTNKHSKSDGNFHLNLDITSIQMCMPKQMRNANKSYW